MEVSLAAATPSRLTPWMLLAVVATCGLVVALPRPQQLLAQHVGTAVAARPLPMVLGRYVRGRPCAGQGASEGLAEHITEHHFFLWIPQREEMLFHYQGIAFAFFDICQVFCSVGCQMSRFCVLLYLFCLFLKTPQVFC